MLVTEMFKYKVVSYLMRAVYIDNYILNKKRNAKFINYHYSFIFYYRQVRVYKIVNKHYFSRMHMLKSHNDLNDLDGSQ